jgi:hypothetical protein
VLELGASASFLGVSRENIMLRLIAALGMAAALAGCAVAPGYYGYPDYGQAYYPGYPYGYGYDYAPVYGSIGIWGGGGGCCYYNHPHGYWHGGDGHWHGDGGHWHGGNGGGHGGGEGGHWEGGGNSGHGH